MAAIIIQSNNSSNLKLIAELAKKLGEQVSPISKTEIEDFALGIKMEKEKTGTDASREEVMALLNGK